MINLPIWTFDKQLFLYLNHFHWPFLDPIMVFISDMGEWAIIWIFFAAIAFIFDRKNGYKALIILLLGLLLEAFINDGVLKHLFFRARPYLLLENVHHLGPNWTNSSFVSGHTASSIVSLIILSYYYKKITLLFLIFATVIIWTRVYLGMHYPTDIIGGVLVGVFSAWIVLRYKEVIISKYARHRNKRANKILS